jgi:hypothetical protein
MTGEVEELMVVDGPPSIEFLRICPTRSEATADLEVSSVTNATRTHRPTASTAWRLCRQRAAGLTSLPSAFMLERFDSDITTDLPHSFRPNATWVTEMEHGQHHFGDPADSGSPVALRHSLAGDLPFRLLSTANMDVSGELVNGNTKKRLQNKVRPPTCHQPDTHRSRKAPSKRRRGPISRSHDLTTLGEDSLPGSAFGANPCTVFSQNEGVTTS